MPDEMSFVDAAALAHAGNLAVQAIDLAGLKSGHRLLINGAGGGVGSLAVQLATHLGVKDITGVDSASKLDFLRELGFTRALDYREVDFTRMGEQFDVIIDARSTRAPADYARALAEGGHYVTVGGETRRILGVALSKGRILKKTGKTVALMAFKANVDNVRLLDLVAAGALAPRIDSTWPLEKTPEAMARFGRGEHRGKIVITID
jgi:NADPH:quinone reductase-like Zn-dependent oxidoreductase